MGEVVSVASVVYNLAGDEAERPNYLKTLVVRNVLSGAKEGIGETLNAGYLNGPAIKLRSFYRWAAYENNYDQVGLPTGDLKIDGDLDPEDVAPFVDVPAGYTAWVQRADIGSADPARWAEQWILVNEPDKIEIGWTAEYVATSSEIIISFEDATTETFAVTDFSYIGRYIYVYYTLIDGSDVVEDTFMFIYRIGSGNAALDDLIENSANYGEFFPFIPIRINNQFISDTHKPLVYKQTKKAFRKVTDSSLDKLVEQIADNDDIGDIDHAYVTFGASLNTRENAARKYIYLFFEVLQTFQYGDSDKFQDWLDRNEQNEIDWNIWYDWFLDPVGPEPNKPKAPGLGSNVVRISGTSDLTAQYDVRLTWRYIQNYSGSGLSKAGAKPGDVWFKHQRTDPVYERYYQARQDRWVVRKIGEYHTMRAYWQRTDGTYTYLEVVGMEHKNFIYSGNAVISNTKQALQDTEESGFIIPLHEETFRKMSLVDSSQMGTSCIFVVFNCYEARKTRWYETGLFKIFIVIAIAIVSALFTPAGFGLLGTYLSVGTALGFTGITAVIVGSVVNALAALVLATILEKTLSGLGVVGTVLSAVIMILAGQVAQSFASGSLAINWGAFLRVDNLMQLTNAFGQGVANMINADTMGMQQEWLDFQENAKREAEKIQQAYFEEFGYGAAVIDPFMFVDSQNSPSAESSSTFLTRTLMTGSEIAQMSKDLLYEFPALSLKLPDAFT